MDDQSGFQVKLEAFQGAYSADMVVAASYAAVGLWMWGIPVAVVVAAAA